jgi:tetratricopeptide (TPR) repeat protein
MPSRVVELWGVAVVAAALAAWSHGASQGSKKTSTLDDARVYREAMAWFKKAEAMIGTPAENGDEQAGYFRKALEIKPDFIEAHYNLGLIYTTQKKPREAVEQFEAVRRLEPKFEGIDFLLASAYRDLGDPAAAVSALERALERSPKDLKLLRALAFLQGSARTDDAARAATFERILVLDATDGEALMALAVLHQKHDRLDEAAARYRALIALEPKNFAAHFNLALILARQKKTAAAREELEAARALSPGNAELLERLGDLYSGDGQHGQAVDLYRGALAKAPDRDVLYAKLGFALAALNRFVEALPVLEKAAGLGPPNAHTLYLLGDVYSELKRSEEAIAAYKRSLEVNPAQKEVHYNLGTVLAEAGRLQDARRELEAAVALDAAYAPAWANLALVDGKLELDEPARVAHERVVALGKGQAFNFFHLGMLYAKKNEPDPAIANLARAIELDPERYRAILREELKKVHSVLDSVRYTERFVRLLSGPAPAPPHP